MTYNKFKKIVLDYHMDKMWERKLPYVLAVDFDDTLCDKNGNEITPICDFIREIKKNMDKEVVVILTTCRQGKTLIQAKKWLEKHKIKIDFFNENSPPHVAYWGECRKIFSHMLIDNTSYNFDVNDFV